MMRIPFKLATLLYAAVAVVAEEAVIFTLFDNGASTGGVEVTLSPSEFAVDTDDEAPPGEAFAVAMSSRIEVSKYLAPKPVIATRAYREDGELITSYDQLQPDEDAQDTTRRVYLVAEGLEFMWPFVSLFHNQTISSKVIPPSPAGPVILESFSETPRVFRVHNMASEDEANAIIATALNATGKDALKRSTVGSGTDANGNDIAHEDFGRTSDNAWDHDSPEAKVMITRSFLLTNIEENAGKRDGLQVVRYMPGQGYNTHPDYFERADDVEFDFNPYSGGSNRFATVFMYLNDPEEGGYTVFPRAPGVGPERELPQEALDMFKKGTWERTVTEQCFSKLAVPPKLGTAALFYSVTPDGRIDPSSHHAACPLIKGTKWGANIWIWNKQRYGDIRTGDPRTLIITNDADKVVYISWEGNDNGKILPGQSMTMNTFEYHRFKASFGSHKEKKFAEFTVQSEPDRQFWEVKPPRHRNIAAAEVEEQDPSRSVVVTHTADEPICLSWKGNEVGLLKPGENTILNTFADHSFDALLGGCDGPVIDTYLVKDQPKRQAWGVNFERMPGSAEREENGREKEEDGGETAESIASPAETPLKSQEKSEIDANEGKDLKGLKPKLFEWVRKMLPGKKPENEEL